MKQMNMKQNSNFALISGIKYDPQTFNACKGSFEAIFPKPKEVEFMPHYC